MSNHFLDDLAKRLGERLLPRRRALELLGAAALGTALMPVMPKQSEALTRKARRRCRAEGGVPLAKGTCHCAMTCTTSPAISCHSNLGCACYETVSGKGFCAHSVGASAEGCSSNADCPTGTECIMVPGAGCSGNSCTSSAECPTNLACIQGICQETFCMLPCPT
jgi:hypothetical protein